MRSGARRATARSTGGQRRGEHEVADGGARECVDGEYGEGHKHEDPTEPDQFRIEQARRGVEKLREKGEEELGQLRVQDVQNDPTPHDQAHAIDRGALVVQR